ncbi:signal peptidase I [Candidatus Phytoplasma luffae]|uniref:Signal peptidase I n=1 Tax=Loofah witches'-broom phytoplasma TaxID=35773 RepID=A0A975FJT6_LOWBP|nr:signal peptidase I [Candidatus Phytoplasma luffae]QTX03131.1 signal peptidase I [Candidatus Phytoplasma luffae]
MKVNKKMVHFKKFFSNFLYFIFYSLFFYLFIVSVISHLKKDLKFNLKYLKFVHCYVGSGSMEPTIKTEDWVIIKYISEEDKKNLKADKTEGDIVVYKDNDTKPPIIHRVIENDEVSNEITTQGDANLLPDQPIKYDRVIGKYVFRIPKSIAKIIFISSFLFFLFLTALFLFQTFSVKKKINNNK